MAGEEKKPLGRILLARQMVSREAIQEVLAAQKSDPSTSRPLVSTLISSGKLSQENALIALSEHFGVPAMDLTRLTLATQCLSLVPRELAEAKKIVPVFADDERVFLVMADPHDIEIVGELEFVTGKKIFPHVAPTGVVDEFIEKAYAAEARGEKKFALEVPKAEEIVASTERETPIPTEAASRPVKPHVDHSERSKPKGLPVRARTNEALTKPPVARVDRFEDEGPETARHVYPEEYSTKPALESDLLARARGGMNAATTVKPPPLETANVIVSKPPPRNIDLDEFKNEMDDIWSKTTVPPSARADQQKRAAANSILVIDDDADIRKMLKRVLETRGHVVIEADRGQLALQMIREHVPAIVIIDAMLPEIHGFDIARRMSRSEKYNNIPMIMISAVYRGWKIIEDIKASCGIFAFIEKPFQLSTLLDQVNAALALVESRKADQVDQRNPDEINAAAKAALDEGLTLYQASKPEEAVEAFRRGIRLDPLAYQLHFNLALVLGKRGDVYGAIQELERSIELNGKHFSSLKNLAVLYERAGFRHKAVEMWERCVIVAPDEATKAQLKEHLSRL
ncbi:MAG: response regulator [Polyangiaceae bacterium]|nr:response regulator [Polyangiaceae bacterium]